MNKVNDVFFDYDNIPNTAHPLIVKVDDRMLSLAGDNNPRYVGTKFTRTYLLLVDHVGLPNEREVINESDITPKILADAMHWVVTGDESLLASNYAFIT